MWNESYKAANNSCFLKVRFENTMRELTFKFTLVFLVFIIMLFDGDMCPQEQGWHLTGPPGGVVTEIAVIPKNTNTILAANMSPFLGLMKGINGGESWEILNKGLEIEIPCAYSTIYACAIDMIYPDTMFISIRGCSSKFEFYRSHNGGENWKNIMEDIVINAIAAKNGKAYASPEDGGLLYSHDGGETWQNIVPFLPSATHLLFDPEDVNTLYVGTYDNGIYRIVFDNSILVEQIGFQSKSVSAMSVASLDSCRLISVAIGGDSVFISQDNGASWTPRNNGLPQMQGFSSVQTLLISPQNPDVLYVGTFEGVYKTVDQGFNWFPTNEGLGIPSIFINRTPIVLKLALDSNDPNIIYAGTDGWGLFKTINGGEQWSLIGIPARSVSGLSVSSLNSELVYAGAQDGFFVRRNGKWSPTTLWSTGTSGTQSVASNPIDSNLVIAAFCNAYFTPLIYKSADGGKTWEMTQMLFDGSEVLDIIFDPVFPTRVYGIWWWQLLDTGGLIISDDSGDTWEIVELDSVEFGGVVTKPLAINPHDTNELYLLDMYGEIYKSTDRALNWSQIRAKNDTVHYAIAIDPSHQENIYVGTFGIWKSSNTGNTWSKIGLNEYVRDLAFDNKTGRLYALTKERGVFYTTDGGDTWDSLDVTPNPYLRMIDIGVGNDYSIIYVGSYETGVFERLEETTPVLLPEIHNKDFSGYTLLQNYPNPFNKETFIKFNILKAAQVSLKIINIRGQCVRTLINEFKQAGEYSICWDGKDNTGKEVASGLYLCQFRYNNLLNSIKILLIN